MKMHTKPLVAKLAPRSLSRLSLTGGGVLTVALLAGCATGPNAHPQDPLEPYNRTMTSFNDAVDKAVMKPVAKGYQTVVPRMVRTGVSNFFGNLGDFWSLVNNALQGKGYETGQQVGRVLVNSFLGLGGLIDVASQAGIEKYREDFGQTLGVWGVGPGPYFVMPFFGPSTIRDTLAWPVDAYGSPLAHVDNVALRNTLVVTRTVDGRARLLEVEDVVNAASIDRYTFLRDAYLQKRRNDVYDGNPPFDEERYDLPESGNEQPGQSGSGQSAAQTAAPLQPVEQPASAPAVAPEPGASAPSASVPALDTPVAASFPLRVDVVSAGTPVAERPASAVGR